MTKHDYSLIVNYDRTPKGQTLFDVYDNPSREKERIYNALVAEMDAIGGYDFRVINGNTYNFSCAYRLTDDNCKQWLIYDTKSYRYTVEYTPAKVIQLQGGYKEIKTTRNAKPYFADEREKKCCIYSF